MRSAASPIPTRGKRGHLKSDPLFDASLDILDAVVEKDGGDIDIDGETDAAGQKKLGTVFGVFLPCVQNIMGVILFLRLPWIAAQAGCFLASAIVLLCALSTLLTALSMSAIVTNGRVPAGGPYFLVSRNVGAEFGGAIGLLFYFGTSVATSLYVLGAVEAFQQGFAVQRGSLFAFDTQALALALTAFLTVVVFIGVKYVNMASTAFLACVLLSILAILIGLVTFGTTNWRHDTPISGCTKSTHFNCTLEKGSLVDTLHPHWASGWNFGRLLALFYPSVTGIMAGANRSDVLKTPSRSIPLGTLSAIGLTTTIYLMFVWMFGAFVSHEALQASNNIIITASVAWPTPILVNVGIIMSCVGAALQTLCGAPRLLAAIAQDRLLPVLTHFETPTGTEPRRALIATWFVASLPCLLGNLDAVTPIVTLCFLAMYCTMNLACFLQAVLKEPTWRPRFNNSCPGMRRLTALLGVLVTLTLMFITNVPFACGLLVITFLLVKYIGSSPDAMSHRWGDVAHGIRFQQARDSLLRLSDVHGHTKTWKPQLLVMCKLRSGTRLDSSENVPLINDAAINLLRLANQLKKGRGLVLVRSVLEGDVAALPEVPSSDDPWASATNATGNGLAKQAAEATTALRGLIQNMGLSRHVSRGLSRSADIATFANVLVARNVDDAIISLAQDAGLGSLSTNTVVLGWPGTWASATSASNAQTVANTCDSSSGLGLHSFVRVLRGIVAAQRAVLIVRGPWPAGDSGIKERSGFSFGSSSKSIDTVSPNNAACGTIDVWWVVQDGGLLLLLPYLLRRHATWRECTLRVFCVIPANDLPRTPVNKQSKHVPAQEPPFAPVDNQNSAAAPLLEKAKNDDPAAGVRSSAEPTVSERASAVKERLKQYLDELRFDAEVHVVQLQKLANEAAQIFVSSPETNVYEGVVLGSSQHIVRSPATIRKSKHVHIESERRLGLQALHECMKSHSSDAELVLVNLPLSAPDREQQTAQEFLEAADLLSRDFKRTILVRGAGNSVVTAEG